MKITANLITSTRIFLLPLPCAFFLYGDALLHWIAFVLFVILGATDFVDGLLARKEGPTELGTFIDPIADKIFLMALLLPLGQQKWVPAWVLPVLLLREFLITVLRSSMALKHVDVPIRLLGKLKTIIQMGGFGTVFLTLYLPPVFAAFAAFCLFLAFIVGLVYYRLTYPRENLPFWMVPVAASFLLWFFLSLGLTQNTSVLVQLVIITILTWSSGIDYLCMSYRLFWQTGIHLYDCLRIGWGLVFPLAALPVVYRGPTLTLMLMIVLSFELAFGGLDVILANRGIRLSSWIFGLKTLFMLCFICSAYLNGLVQNTCSISLMVFSSILTLISAGTFSGTYYRYSHLLFAALRK